MGEVKQEVRSHTSGHTSSHGCCGEGGGGEQRGDHSIKRGEMVVRVECISDKVYDNSDSNEVEIEDYSNPSSVRGEKKRKREDISPEIQKMRKIFENRVKSEKVENEKGSYLKIEKTGYKPTCKSPTPRNITDMIELFEDRTEVSEKRIAQEQKSRVQALITNYNLKMTDNPNKKTRNQDSLIRNDRKVKNENSNAQGGQDQKATKAQLNKKK